MPNTTLASSAKAHGPESVPSASMRTLLLAFAVTASGCSSEFSGSSVTLRESSIEWGLSQTREDQCPVVSPNVTAKVNREPALFSDRGGGSCFQSEIQPYLSSRKVLEWICACRPAVLEVSPPLTGTELEICDGDNCATARWAGATPPPSVELATPLSPVEPVVLQFTPALPSAELIDRVRVLRGQAEVLKTELTWADGSVTLPAHPANAQGVTVVISRSESIEPHWAGFGFCSPRLVRDVTKVEFAP